MDRGNIFSGAAFRATIYATLVLILVFVTIAISGYSYLQHAQYEQSRDRVRPVIEMFQEAYAQGGDAAVLAHLEQFSQISATSHKLLTVTNEDGEIVHGKFRQTIAPQDWHVRSMVTNTETGAAGDYYLTSVQIGSHTFVIGEDLAPLKRVETIFIQTLMFIGALLSLVFIGLGYFTSRTVQRKLDTMGRNLGRFASGDSTARLPVSSQNDQIDRISGTMNRQLDRLSRLMEETRSSAAAIAHDLKRPMVRTMLEVEHALQRAERGEETQTSLENIQTELGNLGNIFEAILRISRIDSGNASVQLAAVDLIALTKDIAETFAVVAEESGQSLTLALPQDTHMIIAGDLGMLAQMFANLLQNAVTHGGPDNKITLKVSNTQAGPVVEVADKGPGIAEADRDKVFDAFYRSETARSTAGNGLGMTLVKSIAERHGANIMLADNAPGLRVIVQFAWH